MTLAELARQAGVWNETVQVFVQRGLVPVRKTYGQRDLEIVRFIGRIQAEHQISLDTISTVLVSECAFDLQAAEEVLTALVQPDPTRSGPGPTSPDLLRRRTGASEELFATLVREGLLSSAGPYAGHHVWIVESVLCLMSAGFTLAETLDVARAGVDIAAHEVGRLTGEVGSGTHLDEAFEGMRLCRTGVGRLISVSRHSGTSAMMARLARASDRGQHLATEPVHVPSRLFVVRHRMDTQLAELEEQTRAIRADVGRASGDEGALLKEYARLLLGMGRFSEAASAFAILTDHSDYCEDAATWAYRGLAQGIEQNDFHALSASARAIALESENPLVHILRAVVLAICAGRHADVLIATARIHEAILAIGDSRRYSARDCTDRLESRLTRGRLCTVLPPAFGLREQGIEDLHSVVEDTVPARAQYPVFRRSGTRELIRLNALFHLGVVYHEMGRAEEAQVALSEVISLDPVSRYATRAYQCLNGRILS